MILTEKSNLAVDISRVNMAQIPATNKYWANIAKSEVFLFEDYKRIYERK